MIVVIKTVLEKLLIENNTNKIHKRLLNYSSFITGTFNLLLPPVIF